MTPAARRAKRALDVLVAIPALIVLVPLFPLLAVLIRADSHGPVLVWRPAVGVQRRSGQARSTGDPRRVHDVGGRLLRLPEFRVTRLAPDGSTPQLTRVGRWLTRSRLHRWPSFGCVLFGDLALVGPRALSPHCVARLRAEVADWDTGLVGVKPGLFGPAQAQALELAEVPARDTGVDGGTAAGAGGPALSAAAEAAAGPWAGAMRDRVLYERDYAASQEAARTACQMLALDLSVMGRCLARGSHAVRVRSPALATLPLPPARRPQCAAHDAPQQQLRPR